MCVEATMREREREREKERERFTKLKLEDEAIYPEREMCSREGEGEIVFQKETLSVSCVEKLSRTQGQKILQ